MDAFIANPRRALRLPLRCAAWIEAEGESCEGHTEDVGAWGCRLVAPARLAQASQPWLRLVCEGAPGVLTVLASVVWAEGGPPWRHGLVFDEAARPRAEAWFDEVALRHVELVHQERVPDRLRLGARLFVTPAPAAAPRLGDEEAVVLRLACSQPTLGQLQRVLGPDWSRAQRALFALLGRGAVTLDEAEAGDPEGWRAHLEADRRGSGPRN